MISITYNTLDLHSRPYNITGYDGYGMPTVDIKSVELARHDGAIQTAQRMGSRTLTVEGQIKTNTKGELIAAIDALKSHLYRPKGVLTVTDEDAITRQFECTPQNVSIIRTRGGATQATYAITFYCPKPYSTSETITLLEQNITAAPFNMGIAVPGSYPASPTATLTINSITAGLQTITLGNDAENRSISIEYAFSPGDTIIIDAEHKNVYVNTIRVDYAGAFPQWQVGGGSVSYTDTADARDVDIVMTATVRNI